MTFEEYCGKFGDAPWSKDEVRAAWNAALDEAANIAEWSSQGAFVIAGAIRALKEGK